MGEFFRPSAVWSITFRYDGRPRRWFRVFRTGIDVRETIEAQLNDLYGDRARLVEVRPASVEEEASYLRGEEPKNAFCPLPGNRTPP